MKFELRSYQIICLGVYEGSPIELTVKYSDNPGSSIFVYGYQLDQAGYAQMVQTFADEQLEVSSYDSTSLSGHIEVKEDGLMFLSIPYAEGWTATVDGKPAEIVSVQDALMGIKLGKGSHDVTIKYTPAGFKEGLMISAVSVFFIALLFIVPAVSKKLKKNKTVLGAAVTAEDVEAQGASIEEVPVSEVMGQDAPAEESSEDIEQADVSEAPSEVVEQNDDAEKPEADND